MNSTSILETLQQQLTPETIQQISQSIGADPAATTSALSTALPVLLGGLSHNAANPQGAAALDQALDDHDGSILGNLGGLLGGGGAGGIGGAILSHILGSKRGAAEQGVARASGLDAGQVGQLLMMLAPLVMGVLGRMKQQGHVDASQLPNVLQQSAQQAETQSSAGGGFLSSILDTNHDGQIADDVARMGKSVLGGIFNKG